MGLLAYLLVFWAGSYLFHEHLSGKRHRLRRKLKHLKKNLTNRIRLDSDILLEKNMTAMQEVADKASELLANKETSVSDIEKFLKGSEKKIEKAYPPKSNSTIRETIEMLVVVFGIVMGIRATFAQPFKIPTGSMQPTLFGVHFESDDELTVPGPFKKVLDWMNYSTTYVDVTIRDDGYLPFQQDDMGNRYYNVIDASSRIGKFAYKEQTQISIGNEAYTLPGSPQQVHKMLRQLYGKRPPDKPFRQGDKLAKGRFLTGDHIMVDRFSYHFVEPKRGDIFVFVTDGIVNPDGSPLSGRHYIKRLVGLPGDTLKIVGGKLHVREKGASEFVVVDGKFDKAFDRIYSGKGGYHGYTLGGYLMTREGEEITLDDDKYFAMGDNSANSHDGRGWGFVPRKNIIGKALMVWWPFSRRWGPADRAEPLDFPSPNMSHLDDE